MRSSKPRCRTKLSLAMRYEAQTSKRATNTGISYRPYLAILAKSRRHGVGERALRIGGLSVAPPVRRPASAHAYGCKALDDAVRYDFEADSHKLFAAVQNLLYCGNVLGSAKITVSDFSSRR